MSEGEFPVNNVAEQYLKSKDPSLGQLRDYYSLKIESDTMDEFDKVGFDNVNEILKILSDVSSKNSENINHLIFDDDGMAKLRDGIRVLSAHRQNRSKELESQVDLES